MPHMKTVDFPERKFALLFLHTTKQFWKEKNRINERVDHSQ